MEHSNEMGPLSCYSLLKFLVIVYEIYLCSSNPYALEDPCLVHGDSQPTTAIAHGFSLPSPMYHYQGSCVPSISNPALKKGSNFKHNMEKLLQLVKFSKRKRESNKKKKKRHKEMGFTRFSQEPNKR